nr:MAG TPA: metallophosphatase domain protein [Caudoviricetes sp.]
MKILTDTGLMVLWQKIKDLYKKTSVSAKQTTTSTADGGTNVITFTFGDSTSTTLSVKNGSKGSDGARGATGATGATGAKGEKGDRGPVGETGPQGNSGIADASSKALINDAVTGGATSYLSAEVGKLGILTYDCSKGGTINHASLQDAINAVPTTFQKAGVSIIYKSGDSIYRYALKSSSWSTDSANWYSVEENLSDVSLLKTRMLGLDYEYNKTISIEGTYTEKFTLSKGTYIIEGLSGTYSSKLSFYKNDSKIAEMSDYLNQGGKEILVLKDDVNYIRYYIVSGKLHFRIKKNSTPIDEELKSLKEETKEISLSQYSCGTLLDSEIIQGQGYNFNADTNSYSLFNSKYWNLSKTDVSTEKAVFIKLSLSNNSNINSQALFLDKDDKVILSLFDRIGKTTQETVTEVIYVPKNAVKLLLQSEESNWIRVFKVVSKGKSNLPYYYFDNNYLNKAIDRIESNKNESDDTVTFAFITDVHFYANAKNAPKLINYIADHTDLAFAIFGGDVPETDRNSISELLDTGKEWNDLCKSDCPNIRIYPCRGNHDYLATINGKTEYASVAQTYNTVMANNIDNFIKGDPSKMYYYFDIPKRKLRIIVLDWYDKGYDYMYMSKEEWDWLAKVLITDNRILIFGHEGSAEKLYVEGENTYCHQTLHSILKACKNKRSVTYEYWIGSESYQQTYDFSKAGDLIACISGHMHNDLYNVDDNLLSICTMCDAMYGSGRVKGTTTEQAFDVFTVNFKNMTIKTVRVGYGSDRSFSL